MPLRSSTLTSGRRMLSTASPSACVMFLAAIAQHSVRRLTARIPWEYYPKYYLGFYSHMETSMNRALQLTIAATLLLTSCTTMEVAQKNLEEGRLVPESVVMTADFLNEYRHPLAPPRRSMAELDIALERKNVLAQGGKL